MAKAKLKLDREINERLDTIVEDDVRKGWKLVTLPDYYQEMLQDDELPELEVLRFLRMNPARKRTVAELVQRRYHKDLQDENLLSEAQVRVLAAKRGEWTEDHEKRLADASTRSNALMTNLYASGFASGAEKWAGTIQGHTETVREALDGNADLLEVFNRWIDYKSDLRDEYTVKYAELQQLPRYSPDRDFMALTQDSEAVSALIEELDDLKTRVENYFDLLKVRQEQMELQVRRDRLFDQTAESRRDTAEELARLYVTTTVCSTEGLEVGPLAPTFDALWQFPFEVLQYLTSEAYLWHNGIPDEAREYLEVFGFLANKRPNGPVTPSDASLDETTPSSDSPPQDTTPVATSE
jgi:hypothetical protein